jgi:hypothetical protein
MQERQYLCPGKNGTPGENTLAVHVGQFLDPFTMPPDQA